MIIDVHGHFTMAPSQLLAFRAQQLAMLNKPRHRPLSITDEELRNSLSPLLGQMEDRGIDMLVFSPRAAGMGHDIGDACVSRIWSETNNDLILRACEMAPECLLPACQLPQSPGVGLDDVLQELDRCAELGFVGCVINPDVSGGLPPFTPSLGDEYWYPLWQRLVELQMPAMIHASATRNPATHMHATHYIAGDLAATVELTSSRVFEHFPDLKVIIPHGGGAMPYQFNRHRAIHVAEDRPPFELAVRNLYFDTVVYDRDSLEMLIRKVGADRVVFGSEMFGTGKAIDPKTGRPFDDNLSLIEDMDWLSDEERQAVLETNARNLFLRAGAAWEGDS